MILHLKFLLDRIRLGLESPISPFVNDVMHFNFISLYSIHDALRDLVTSISNCQVITLLMEFEGSLITNHC